MSSTNLHTYPVDGYQRVSYYCSGGMGDAMGHIAGNIAGENATGDGLVICKNLILGCKPEKADDFRPFIFEPTWCVYIKAEDNVDMGRYVRRVTFRMSPRLPLRLHVADSSPFEITEVLSTDFPLELQVDYLEKNMSSTTYFYKPNDVFDGKYNVDLRMNFKGHERKDRMFFMNPSLNMQLRLNPPPPPPPVIRLPIVRPKPQQQPQLQPKKEQQPEEVRPSLKTFMPTFQEPQIKAPRPIFNVRLPTA